MDWAANFLTFFSSSATFDLERVRTVILAIWVPSTEPAAREFGRSSRLLPGSGTYDSEWVCFCEGIISPLVLVQMPGICFWVYHASTFSLLRGWSNRNVRSKSDMGFFKFLGKNSRRWNVGGTKVG